MSVDDYENRRLPSRQRFPTPKKAMPAKASPAKKASPRKSPAVKSPRARRAMAGNVDQPCGWPGCTLGNGHPAAEGRWAQVWLG